MDTTIQSLYNLRQQEEPQTRLGAMVSTTRIGVEVEVENLPERPSVAGWRCISDGSLRNEGAEYVFRGPTGGLTAEVRLRKLEKVLSEYPMKDFSVRTSVHVHMDVRDMTWNQVCDMMVLYAIVEPYLFSICGQEREESIYALSLYRGQGQVKTLRNLIQSGAGARIGRFWSKYSAVNLLSLESFGSVEFRGHRGTSDANVLINWINHLLSLREFVMNPDNDIKDLPRLMSQEGITPMLVKVFGQSLVRKNMRNIAGVAEKLHESVWVAEDLIYDPEIRKNGVKILEETRGSNQLEKLRDKLCAV